MMRSTSAPSSGRGLGMGASPMRVTWRNKWDHYVSLRQRFRAASSSRAHDASNPLEMGGRRSLTKLHQQGLLDGSPGSSRSEDAVVEVGPMWMQSVDDVRDDLRAIRSKMDELDAQHAAHLKVGFDDNHDAAERDIEVLTTHITKLYQRARFKVLKIGEGVQMSGQEGKMRDNLQHALAKELQALSGKFRSSQKAYLNDLDARRSTSARFGDARQGDDVYAFSGNDDAVLDGGFTNTQLALTDTRYDFAVERDRELRAVAKSIMELSEIFKDLAILVIDQGTILDRIDYNLEQTAIHTKDAVYQLTEANEKSKSARMRNCILLLCVLIIIVLLIIIVRTAIK